MEVGVNEEIKKKKRKSDEGRHARRVRARDRVGSEITDRDIEIVGWLGRHRLATADQVMRRFEMQRSKAYQRLGVLVDEGLARHEQGVRSPRVYLATRAGLGAADLDLPRATVSAASFAHDAAVVDVAIAIERSGRFVLTEREIRRADARGSHVLRLSHWESSRDTQRGAWPDLVIIDRVQQTMTAVEVELTLKKASRINDKLIAYASSRYERVQYVCGSNAIRAVVERESKRTDLRNRLELVDLAIATDVASRPVVDDVGDALGLLEQVRAEARAASVRATEAERRLAAEYQAGRALIDQIGQYLRADRSMQREIRVSWERLVGR